MEFLNEFLPILLYVAGIVLLIVLIILGIKAIKILDNVEDIVEDAQDKLDEFDLIQKYLLSEVMQKTLEDSGRRTWYGGINENANPKDLLQLLQEKISPFIKR